VTRRRFAVEAAGGVVLRGSGAAREVLVVHRPHHADWSLPKGKLDPGEDHRRAAVREVREETGVAVDLGAELPAITYDVPQGRKRVRWFAMSPVAPGADDDLGADDADEVDEVRWATIADALDLLTYDQERATLASALDLHP
jgi:8-oxo-dGTP pyrophosphatase MutT (NUDIX family)